MPGLHAARHQVIARAFRRGARHERRFDFEEACASQILAHRESDFRAQNHVALHLRPAQIDIAIFQPHFFRHIHRFFHGERRRARFVQNPDLLRNQIYLAGRQIRVHRLGRAQFDQSFHCDHVFAADEIGLFAMKSIDSAAARVRALVPEARVVVAHGQMPEEQLERTVEGFWDREFDILVCTTIVETGLDISTPTP